jgi:hypothetical protein
MNLSPTCQGWRKSKVVARRRRELALPAGRCISHIQKENKTNIILHITALIEGFYVFKPSFFALVEQVEVGRVINAALPDLPVVNWPGLVRHR